MKAFNKIIGNFGEETACKFLEKNGYKILERNFRSISNKEIDIIALNKKTICFIEVKTRTDGGNFGDAFEAIDYKKRLSYSNAASSYLALKKISSPARFDVVSVVLGPDNNIREIKLLQNAFEIEAGV